MTFGQRLRRFGASVWGDWPKRAYLRERYQQRLVAVQNHLAECLDSAPEGPVRILSMCAGDGRDVVGVLSSHRRRPDATAWLVELNRQSVTVGALLATRSGLIDNVRFLNEDATTYATYRGIAPADVVLVCGVWGHVPADEKRRLAQAMGSLCKPGGRVIWTRGVSKGMSRLHEVEALFAGPHWEKVRAGFTPDQTWAVATHRYRGPAHAVPADGRIFHFQRSAG
jgi:hypothetical protein